MRPAAGHPVGDETVGEMWSLFDGQDVLNEIDPAFSANIARHVRRAQLLDPFHVSANTDPKGNRALRPQDQDPDVLLHVVGETGHGIVVRGAKFETAAAYANQAFVKPTIGEWNNEVLSDYAVGFLADMGAPGVKHICRSAFAAERDPDDHPLTSRYDEIDTMIVFDDVEIPWENVFSTGTPRRPRSSARPCTGTASIRTSSATCASPTSSSASPTPAPGRPGSRCTRACARRSRRSRATARASTRT